jgi:hypothetical protein
MNLKILAPISSFLPLPPMLKQIVCITTRGEKKPNILVRIRII